MSDDDDVDDNDDDDDDVVVVVVVVVVAAVVVCVPSYVCWSSFTCLTPQEHLFTMPCTRATYNALRCC